jgi:8-oxo-dGTP diphosphatase
MVIQIAGCFIVVDEKVLVLYRMGREYFMFPGGKVDPGENFEEAAIREAKEEIGVDVSLGESLGEFEFVSPFGNDRYGGNCFLATIVSGSPLLMEPDKFSKLFWMPLSDFEKYPLSPNVRHYCEVFRDQTHQ